ncbi:DUF4097 family beta strand repeat-containing protein [Halococcus saccharolyticus]|nr:DUF4097 family beta strand repeat-containing protein [Halococcus saccharolyticus]
MTAADNSKTTTPTVTRRGLLGACAVGLSATAAGCSGATPFVGKRTEFDRTFDGNTGRITVETDSGDVNVSRTDADEIQLHGIKEAASVFADIEDITVEATRDGDHLRITGDSGESSFLGLGNKSISLDAGVPEGVAVERVSAANGDTTATDVAGNMTIESTNGAVKARNVDGHVSLASTNGDASARNVAGLDGAETTNGDVDVAIPAVEGEVSVASTNGAITAALAPDLDATVVASTRNGTITTNRLPLDAVGSGSNTVRGTLGDGTHDLSVETINGDIVLDRLR